MTKRINKNHTSKQNVEINKKKQEKKKKKNNMQPWKQNKKNKQTSSKC